MRDGDRPSGALNRVRHQLHSDSPPGTEYQKITGSLTGTPTGPPSTPHTHIGHIMNYHTKPSIDISSYTGTVKVLKSRKVKRHGNPNRIKCPGVRLTWAAMIKEARKVS